MNSEHLHAPPGYKSAKNFDSIQLNKIEPTGFLKTLLLLHMPFVKNSRNLTRRNYRKNVTTWKKRTNSPYYGRALSRSGFTRQVVGPQGLIRKLRYADSITINPGAASAIAEYNFGANCAFDPDLNIGGHQPLGFDCYMTMYDHYKVLQSKITCTVVGNETSGPQFVFGIYLDDDQTAVSDLNRIVENGNTSYAVITTGNANGPTQLVKSFNTKNFFANKSQSAELVGSDASNPAERAIYKLFAQALEPSVDVAQFRVFVVIDYTIMFSERKTTIQS